MSSHFRKEYFCDWLMINEGLIVEEGCVKESVDILLHEELPFVLQSKVPAASYHQASFQSSKDRNSILLHTKKPPGGESDGKKELARKPHYTLEEL